jgi:hypothetical protein
MKKLIWFGLSLVALSATPIFATLTSDPPSYTDATKPPSAPPLEENFRKYYNKIFAQPLDDPSGLAQLYGQYSNADAHLKADMDEHLLVPILQSLKLEDARDTLTKLAPFFFKFFFRDTTWTKGHTKSASGPPPS